MDTTQIKKIARVLDDNDTHRPITMVNHYLANGWVLLGVKQIENTEYSAVAYVLGTDNSDTPFYKWESEAIQEQRDYGIVTAGTRWEVVEVQQ